MIDGNSDTLRDRLADMAAEDGLVHVQFTLRNRDEATTERVCGEVLRMLDAWENGESIEFSFGDSKRPAEFAGIGEVVHHGCK